MDIDGSLTDGKIYVSEEGECFKAFNVKDGYAIANLLPKYKIEPVVITGRESTIVSNRCCELGIKEVYQGITNKMECLNVLLKRKELLYENVAYFGDDLPDMECMQVVGLSGCPGDAVREIKEIVDYISVEKGGEGAVRNFIEWIIDKGHVKNDPLCASKKVTCFNL